MLESVREKSDFTVLGIESSCDETAAAVVKGGRQILSNVISSQISLHARYGGVVPELASRNHTMAVISVINQALKDSGTALSDIDAVAVTYGAGLVGALLVGVSAAKALSYAAEKPLIKVNHIEAHICANYAAHENLRPPFLAAVASGGHTSIIEVKGFNDFALVGSTSDDAVGEAFDKVARLIGLPYPGGPAVEKLARDGKRTVNFFKTEKRVKSDFTLSYSGLKTAVVNYVHSAFQRGENINREDLCASFQAEAFGLLNSTVIAAAGKYGYDKIVLAGGVASNGYFRSSLTELAKERGITVLYPPPALCTDNAVMVASRGFFAAAEGKDFAGLDLNAVSNLRVKA